MGIKFWSKKVQKKIKMLQNKNFFCNKKKFPRISKHFHLFFLLFFDKKKPQKKLHHCAKQTGFSSFFFVNSHSV
jgi:hypothetical protein